MQNKPTGIIERLKAASTKKEVTALRKELGGFKFASPKTTRKFNRIANRKFK
jgi:hypothetical protein